MSDAEHCIHCGILWLNAKLCRTKKGWVCVDEEACAEMRTWEVPDQ